MMYMTQQQINGPRKVNPVRFHLTPQMTRDTAKQNSFTGKCARYTCITSSSICFWRLVGLAVSPFNPVGQWIFLILFAPVAIGICYTAFPFMLAAIWRDSGDYHKRTYQKYLGSYIYEEHDYWIETTKKSMYAIWVKIDDSMPVIMVLSMFLTFMGGWLATYSVLAGWNNTLQSAFFAGYWGIILAIAFIVGLISIYAAVKGPINSGHMEDDADQYEKHRERCDKIHSVKEIQEITERAKGISTTTPAGNLPKGATLSKIGKGKEYDVTAQYRTLPNAVDLEVDPMDELPQKGNR
jgi:hypothetical protein